MSQLGFVILLASLLGVVSCGDEGEQLGATIAHAAKRLRASSTNELTISFQPKESGTDYAVGIARAQYCPHPPCAVNDNSCVKNSFSSTSGFDYICSLTLSGRSRGGKRYGGTDWAFSRYVGVPRTLFVEKTDSQPTLIVLRKAGDHVEVVDLR